MKRLLLCLPLLLALAACGEDDGGTGPTGPVFDQITVSLDQINIVQDCDNGGGGEFQYKFYVIVYENDVETARYFSDAYSSFTATNFTAWDPGNTQTFTLERSANVRFSVRLSVRESDSVEDFSQGSTISHVNAAGRPAWAPKPGDIIDEYTLYDSAKHTGLLEWEFWARSSCQGIFTYSVTVEDGTAP